MASARKTKPWFAPKRYGYGASLPITWQGWVALSAFVALVVPAASTLHGYLRVGAMLLATIGFVALCAWKTEGGWRWRWGGRP